jgi:UDP-glucose:(heptosyl)LPS alpha-1,3-glucosyltransferase
MYYRLVEFVEGCAYNGEKVALCAVSEKTAEAILKYCGCQKLIKVVYNGVDVMKFNPERRRGLRSYSRATLGIAETSFAVLLIGNDWKKKGLQYLIEAAGILRNPNVRILVAGRDTVEPYQESIERLGIAEQVLFLPVRPDVEFYYAAADAYAGPSLDDSFAIPPLEAMACGLPVITTRFNGGCAIMHHGVDGLILEDPADSLTLSAWLQRLSTDTEWRANMGAAAARTAAQYTWERNALEIRSILDSAAEVTLARGSAVKETRT